MALHFDLTDLRLMVQVAEANRVTGGAQGLSLSVPAASTRVENLEESLGAKLLLRVPQGATLAPSGQAFVQHARRVLGQFEHRRSDLQEYVQGIKGRLRVWASANRPEGQQQTDCSRSARQR